MEVASEPETTATQPGGRGRGGGGRGRGSGDVLVLQNPRYLKRKLVVPSPPRDGRGADRTRSTPAAGSNGMDFGGAPAPALDDAVSPVAPPADSGKTPGRRLNKKPEKGAAGRAGDSEGGPRGQGGKAGKGGRKGRGRDDDNREALARNPRKKGKKGRNTAAAPPPPMGPPQVLLEETITVGELASQLRVGAAEVVKDLMRMGVLASITQSIDAATAEKVANGYDAIVTRGGGEEGDVDTGALGVIDEEDDDTKLEKRPPVVTIMGHVDHGKTSLLDALRTANVAGAEAGGITQHIGAYSVPAPDGESTVTFIDTPGHAAFDEMRSRGANVTDIVILAVAADDGVMAQTVQSIRAAKAAGVPIIVALTKSDKPDADPQKVKLELLEKEVVLEEFGGDVLSQPVSAKTGDGLEGLFEQIALQADILDLKANPDRPAAGTVIEARQVQGQGAVATVLVQRGTLRVGDIIVAGAQWGRVRALVDDSGGKADVAPPSAAVEVVGLSGLPEAGDALTVTPDDQKARELAETRQRLLRDRRSSALFATRSQSEQQLFLGGLQGSLPTKLLDFVVKADVQGSAEALASALTDLEAADDKLMVRTRVLRSGAGAITNEDVMLASVSNALVLGFNSAASAQTREEAAKVNVDIREYSVVYDALDDVKAMMAALIRPPPSKQLGELCGTLDVQQIFKIGAVGKVAGCRVLTGFIRVGCNIRILRGNIIVYEGKLQSLRSGKDIVEQVDEPNECGMSFDDFQGMEGEDRVEAYAAREVSDDE